MMLARRRDRRVERAGDADPVCGSRPSTAVSSEIVILTWRLLQTSREAMPSSRGPDLT
jgi:hypothetical protein